MDFTDLLLGALRYNLRGEWDMEKNLFNIDKKKKNSCDALRKRCN